MKTLYIIASLLLTAGLHQLQAQGLVYRPNNPAFGGNTFNYQWLLSSAQAQDTHKDPTAKNASSSSFNGLGNGSGSSLQSFTDNLQRQLLSRLSQNILNKQFGDDGLKEGTFSYGDMEVVITKAAEGVVIRISDGKGGESSITVPYL